MIDSEVTQLPSEPDNPYALALTIYLRGIALVLIVLGLRHWLFIVGVFEEDGWNLQTMNSAWRFVTIHLGVIDLVAAVGLWMRVSWGNVLWIYVTIFELAMHTVFAERFGFYPILVGFQTISLCVFVALLVMEKRFDANPR
ncbi:DUF6163 family protein [Kaistia dalseonensis]|uniref:DUF2127 domain-containing protein n=1 Tax=Kaistia dalseonensis TaxID=410840 RepID=A0ABU0H4D6_9HYPH|nr:DUF6163 family protein [Kaistia dalseonensis]MCX5493814.1 DUF6163 family protein [Kaistia dalseonensis]MDQ0436379.1 hypothetical protein [Kaistia dalseonensis]